MTENQLSDFKNKTFLRLSFDDIQFIQVSTGVNCKRKRRGTWRFGVKMKEVVEGDGLNTTSLRVFIHNPAAHLGLENLFLHDGEKSAKESLTEYCEQNIKPKGKRYLLKNEKVFKPEGMETFKDGIIKAIQEPDQLRLKLPGVAFRHIPGVGNIEITQTDKW